MPTATGLPRVGERVKYTWLNQDMQVESAIGTVVRRGGGSYWTLWVRWDGQTEVKMLVDASYFWDADATPRRGMLRPA